jgi:hypothetical protein
VSRGTFRFREYTVARDTEPDAEPVTIRMECVVCGESGPAAGTSDEALGWAVTHLKTSPEHLTYREVITRPYRAVPGAWQ